MPVVLVHYKSHVKHFKIPASYGSRAPVHTSVAPGNSDWPFGPYTKKTKKTHSPLQRRESTGASFLYRLDWKSKHFSWNVHSWMKIYPTKLKSFQRKIVQMGALQKLQNSIQTLIIFWFAYPIHTNSLFWVTFVELLFCHFPPPNNSIRGKDSQIYWIFHLNIFVFQTNGKQPHSFPVLSRFWNGL